MTHHPHVHMIVPGGGISLDGTRWIGCRPKYLLPVKVLSRLFRRLKLEMLLAAHDAGRLQFFGDHAHLADKTAFKALSRATASDQVVRLQQVAVRDAGGVGGDEPAVGDRDPMRVAGQIGQHLLGAGVQVQGLPHQGARPLQDHNAQAGRVYPPLPHARLAKRVP